MVTGFMVNARSVKSSKGEKMKTFFVEIAETRFVCMGDIVTR